MFLPLQNLMENRNSSAECAETGGIYETKNEGKTAGRSTKVRLFEDAKIHTQILDFIFVCFTYYFVVYPIPLLPYARRIYGIYPV